MVQQATPPTTSASHLLKAVTVAVVAGAVIQLLLAPIAELGVEDHTTTIGTWWVLVLGWTFVVVRLAAAWGFVRGYQWARNVIVGVCASDVVVGAIAVTNLLYGGIPLADVIKLNISYLWVGLWLGPFGFLSIIALVALYLQQRSSALRSTTQ